MWVGGPWSPTSGADTTPSYVQRRILIIENIAQILPFHITVTIAVCKLGVPFVVSVIERVKETYGRWIKEAVRVQKVRP